MERSSTPRAPKRSLTIGTGGSLPSTWPDPAGATPRWRRRIDATPSSPSSTPKRPLRRIKRRALFPTASLTQKGILYMSYDRVLREQNKSQRLHKTVWIGLRAPWGSDPCPLCHVALKSMLCAYQHFKRTHNARKVLCLCGKCGASYDYVAPATRHASRCRAKKFPTQAGIFRCEYCSKGFASGRGLSQHLRGAHPIVYMKGLVSRGKDPSPPDVVYSLDDDDTYSGQPDPTRSLYSDTPVRVTPSRMRASLLSSLGRSDAPTLRDINERAVALLSTLRRRFHIMRLCNFSDKRRQCVKKPKKLVEFASLQRAWLTKRREVATRILDGRVPSCTLRPDDIESHYRAIWEAPSSFKALKGFADLPEADNTPLLAPISPAEVIASVKRVKPLSSPGPDSVRRAHLLAFDGSGVKLAAMFNDWLLCGDIPAIFKRGRTTLIPKSLDPLLEQDIKNWRPITLSSLILRVFTRIWAGRLEVACPPHPRQRGFIKGPGCSENLTVLGGLMKLSKRRKSTLACAFIDLAKAFDTVPHELILSSLQARGLDDHFLGLIRNMYTGVNSRISSSKGRTSKIFLKLGVKQGDPLSPLLFNLSLDPLLYALDRCGEGIEVGGGLAVTSLAYADDLVLLSSSWLGMKRNLAILDAFSDLCGLRSNPSKTHAFLLRREGTRLALNNCDPWTLGGSVVRLIPPTGAVRYLGVDISPLKGITGSAPIVCLTTMIQRIDGSRLKPSQKITLLRSYALPRILYSADHAETSFSALSECDRAVRRIVKKWLHLGHHVTDGLLYSAGRCGGLGFPRLCTAIPACRLRRLLAMCTSEEPLTNEVASMISLERSVLKLYSHVTKTSLLSRLEDVNPELVSAKALKDREFRRWASLPSQGLGTSLFNNDSASNSWLLSPRACHLSESEFILALQIRTNTFSVRLNGASVKDCGNRISCRLCGHERETLGHIVSCCPSLKENRMRAHNTICLALRRLAEEHGWMAWSEKRLTLPDGQVGVPDLVLYKNNSAHIIDVAIVYERNPTCLSSVSAAKALKYTKFAGEVNRWLQASSISMWGFVVGAKGKWPRSNRELLIELGLSLVKIRSVSKKMSVSSLIGSMKTCRAFRTLIRS